MGHDEGSAEKDPLLSLVTTMEKYVLVVVMVIFFFKKFCVKKIVYILKRNMIHAQSHAQRVVTSLENQSISLSAEVKYSGFGSEEKF